MDIDDDDFDERPLRRPRKTTTTRTAMNGGSINGGSKKKTANGKKEEEEEASVKEERPKRKTTKKIELIDIDDDDDDEAGPSPTKKSKASAKSPSSKKKLSSQEDDDAKTKGRKKATKKTEEPSKDSDDDEAAGPSVTKKSKAPAKSAKSKSKKASSQENGEAKERVKSITVKGKAPVDSECPVASNCHVYHDSEGVWDCMLNQTCIQRNNNKFYLIQLLEEDSSKRYQVWMRWGRVGYKGQVSLQSLGDNLAQAKRIFEKKFADKTKNDWLDREDFDKVPGKYDLVKMDYSAPSGVEVDKALKKDEVDSAFAKKIPDSELKPEVQDLIKLVCDINTMEQTVIEMKYDTKKAPLGKITTEQIRAGYEALKRISEAVGIPSRRSELMEACNDFYTRIPHEFGMSVPTPINSLEAVKSKIQLLEALGDIQVAIKILNDNVDLLMNPVDRHYKQLACLISHLDKDAKDYQLIEDYIRSTHAKTHSQYTLDVQDIFDCRKDAEEKRFKDQGNRMLLFHGSRMSNWAGILGHGLKIAPPEAPVTGYMFGKGVYFADMSSKSANYCWTTPSKNVGLLMLCEVSLGKPNELVDACYTADQLPKGTHSVKGLGQVAPDPSKTKKLSCGTLVPMGPSVETKVKNDGGKFTLNYNEYIVYDVSQIKMRYLAKIKFNYKY